jgi:hypothetical protein
MSEPRSTPRTYQFPFAGGLLCGIGMGLLILPLLNQAGFVAAFGFVGVLGVAFVCIVLGVAVGLPTRGSRKSGERTE